MWTINNSCITFKRAWVVERPWTHPNWFNVCIIIIKVIKVSANKLNYQHVCNSISNCNRFYIRLNMPRRKSFGTGVILEILHWSGTMPWWSDEWIIDVTGAAKKLASSLRILWEIPSGPTDLFNLTLLSSERTSSISAVYWDGRGDNLFLKSSNHDWLSVMVCLVTSPSHKYILIVLAELELSTGT